MTKIFIAGHNGMVGSAIYRQLKNNNDNEILVASRNDVNLQCQDSVNSFIKSNNIDHIYLAAAKVGGIHANNTYPAEFIYENLMIQNNIIHSSHKNNINKLIFLGSSCIYPVQSSQPIQESSLLTGSLEETNRSYAIAKIAGIELCKSYNKQYGRDYRCVMPTNLYAPHDTFHLENSHVIPSLIMKFYEAVKLNSSEVIIWGSGSPLREFMHVNDMSSACIHIMSLTEAEYRELILNNGSHVNVGTGEEISIRDLALLISKISGFKGKIIFDEKYPDGAPRKLLDCSLLKKSGFESQYDLEDGLRLTYQWYAKNTHSLK